MLSHAQVANVRALLAEGLSQRQVAELTGVSRGSVGNIVAGRCPATDPVDPNAPRDVPKYRCPGCGVMVTHDPCSICAQQRIRERRKAS